MARVLTGIWTITGLIIQGSFVAIVTLSLVSQSLDADFKLYGSKVNQTESSSLMLACEAKGTNNLTPSPFFASTMLIYSTAKNEVSGPHYTT